MDIFKLVKETHEQKTDNQGNNPLKVITGPKDYNNLSSDLRDLRIDRLQEELDEFKLAVDRRNTHDQLDALVDIVYIALGTAYLQGFDFNEAFRRVDLANKTKVLASTCESVSESKYNNPLDWVKPRYFTKPDLTDLVQKRKRLHGIILIEGPDACGKTTLAQSLMSLIDNAEYLHNSYYPDTNMEAYSKSFLHMLSEKAKSHVCIVDRSFISTIIYEYVYRQDRSVMDTEGLYKLWNDIDLPKIVVKAIGRTPERCLEFYNRTKDREMYKDQPDEKYLDLCRLFNMHIDTFFPDRMVYDRDNDMIITDTVAIMDQLGKLCLS
jgi:thymidylate kinase